MEKQSNVRELVQKSLSETIAQITAMKTILNYAVILDFTLRGQIRFLFKEHICLMEAKQGRVTIRCRLLGEDAEATAKAIEEEFDAQYENETGCVAFPYEQTDDGAELDAITERTEDAMLLLRVVIDYCDEGSYQLEGGI